MSFLFCFDSCVGRPLLLCQQSELISVSCELMRWTVYVIFVVSAGSVSENLLSICLYEPGDSYLLCYAVELFDYPFEFLYG